MKTLVFGAGNLLLSDEGFGVHCVRYLEAHYEFPPEVELLDGGTLGIFIAHQLEEAERVYIIDTLASEASTGTTGILEGLAPGHCLRFSKQDFILQRIPLKLSPHQIGIQEMLLLSELRGRCPQEIHLLGVIPESFAPGSDLTPCLVRCLPSLAARLVDELRAQGHRILGAPGLRESQPSSIYALSRG